MRIFNTSPIWMAILAAAVMSSLGLAPQSRAQMGQGQQSGPVVAPVDSLQTELHMLTDVQRQSVDSGQQKAYQAFYKVPESDPDKRIQLGNSFLQKYPKSPLDEGIDVGLTNAYYAKQDWNDFYATADKALALNPDEVDVLTNVGWVIPHEYDPNSANAAQQLDKAETYEKHALEVLAKMPKPKGTSDVQFAAMKLQKQQEAHSALGLVYFRRGDYANSVSELQQSTQTANPDQTDLYVLGVDLQNLNRKPDAVAAFQLCAKITGPLQAQCRQGAGQGKQ
jgi:tetratricopeptide (TPR) repeat protein